MIPTNYDAIYAIYLQVKKIVGEKVYSFKICVSSNIYNNLEKFEVDGIQIIENKFLEKDKILIGEIKPN